MVRTIVPLAVASVVFALLWPLTCTGGADGAADPRMFCETFWRWKLPWSRIDGPVGVIAMLVLPLVAAVAAFLLLRATVRPDDGT
jgi:hypothetical protein